VVGLLVVVWGMEQGCKELDGSVNEVEQPLEAMQLPVLPMQLEDDCFVLEQLEEQLAGVVVELEEEVVQLAELVVVEVAWAMEQGCEKLHGSNVEVE
jgi:hypothetical protein